MAHIKVRAHKRKDGTVVRAHQRKHWWSRKDKNHNIRPTDSLYSLTQTEVSGIQKQPSDSVVSANVDKFGEQGEKLQGLGALLNKVKNKKIVEGFAFLPLVGTIGAPLLGSMPLALAMVALGALPFVLFEAGKKVYEKVNAKAYSQHLRDEGALFDVDKKQVEQIAQNAGYQTKPSHASWKQEDIRAKSRVLSNGLGVVDWKVDARYRRHVAIPVEGKTYFYPGADLSETTFSYKVNLSGVNLAGANLQKSRMYECNLDGANFEGANLSGFEIYNEKDRMSSYGAKRTFRGANFKNADLRGAALIDCDFTGADFTGANMESVQLGTTDFTKIKMGREQAEQIMRDNLHIFKYNKLSFNETVERLGISEQKFEYLVLSGAIQVRTNRGTEIVSSKFDPDLHHVPIWEIETIQKILSESDDAPS